LELLRPLKSILQNLQIRFQLYPVAEPDKKVWGGRQKTISDEEITTSSLSKSTAFLLKIESIL
jgi:hypothetical protein